MMRSMMLRASAALAALALLATLSAGDVAAQGFGNVKGTIVYGGEKLPDNPKVELSNDKAFCMKGGDVYRNEWVVDAKSKGIKWALVWLTDEKNANGKGTAWTAPIANNLKAVPKEVIIDQPICTFLPRMTAMREGSTLIVKNSATIPHNTSFQGGLLGPTMNQLIPPGRQLDAGMVKARPLPFSYSCSIHTWMKGWVGVFKHPYYAVTNEKGEFEIKDAPAGKFRLMVWHEGAGYLQKNPMDRGEVIVIKAKDTTEVKPIKFEQSKE